MAARKKSKTTKSRKLSVKKTSVRGGKSASPSRVRVRERVRERPWSSDSR